MVHITRRRLRLSSRRVVQPGVTLIELMIAVSLITVIGLGFAGAFSNIAKAIQFSRAKTLAANLAQEQMQYVKQQAFHRILVTTATVYESHFPTDLPYDTSYYPPENILEGGVTFSRYTHIQVTREDSGSLSYFGAVPDTGMKAILVSVVWQSGNEYKKYQLRNIITNLDTLTSNSVLSGKVTIFTSGANLPGAKVTVAENVGFEDTSNGSGDYSINVYAGNYTLIATANGFFPQFRNVSVGANSTAVTNFPMLQMSSGVVRGTAWYNDHLVISQVCASTFNLTTGLDQEYVELFNPTTATWTIGTGGGSSIVRLMYQRYADVGPTEITMTYNNLTVAPSSYYLFANVDPVVVRGVTRAADAVYRNTNAGYPDIIWDVDNNPGGSPGGADADAVGILLSGASDTMDAVGWTKNPGTLHIPQKYEGAAISQVAGFQTGEQYVRFSSTAGVSNSLARAYDSNNNNVDFLVNSSNSNWGDIHNTSDIQTIVAGTPADGAYVTVTDGLSSVATATLVGNPPYAFFHLPAVATGTWALFISSNDRVMEISSVTMTPGATVYAPNSVTVPVWPSSNWAASILSMRASQGYVTGWVKNVLAQPISPGITLQSTSGESTQSNVTNGTYFLRVATGITDVTANPSNLNSQYVSLSSQSLDIQLGQVTSNVNFSLSQGGRVRGSATRDGINALPGIAFSVLDVNGYARGSGVSGSDGRFMVMNIATGTYTVEPILGSGESSTPPTTSATVSAGSLVDVGTFTISGSFGYVRGNVTVSGKAIRSGVLVVCSTSTLTAPPTINAASLTNGAIYIGNSSEDGTYVLNVRGSTVPYKVYGYYTTYNVTTPSTTYRSQSGITVTAGSTISGVNLAW